VVDGVLAAHAAMRPKAKRQEVLVAGHILLAFLVEALWVEFVRILVPLRLPRHVSGSGKAPEQHCRSCSCCSGSGWNTCGCAQCKQAQHMTRCSAPQRHHITAAPTCIAAAVMEGMSSVPFRAT
jgi:hypothetical protein